MELVVVLGVGIVCALAALGAALSRTPTSTELDEGACIACGGSDVEPLVGPGGEQGTRCLECGYEGGEAVMAIAREAERKAFERMPIGRRWLRLLDCTGVAARAAADHKSLEAALRDTPMAQDGEARERYRLLENRVQMAGLQASHDRKQASAIAKRLGLTGSHGLEELVEAATAGLVQSRTPFSSLTPILGTLNPTLRRRVVQRWGTAKGEREPALYRLALDLDLTELVLEGLGTSTPPEQRASLARDVVAKGGADVLGVAAEVLMELDPRGGPSAIFARHQRAVADEWVDVVNLLAPWADAEAARRARSAGALTVAADDASGGLSPTGEAGALSTDPGPHG